MQCVASWGSTRAWVFESGMIEETNKCEGVRGQHQPGDLPPLPVSLNFLESMLGHL